MSASAEMSEGEIRKVSKDSGKLTIEHGEIKHLDMSPMAMMLTAKATARLDAVAVGNKEHFLVKDEGGKMVVTEVQLGK